MSIGLEGCWLCLGVELPDRTSEILSGLDLLVQSNDEEKAGGPSVSQFWGDVDSVKVWLEGEE
jgi:hypothetical protein